MQVQIKRQLKIELDQADITSAVKQFLSDAGHHISDEDLAKINYVKSPKDGLRAELSINDEVVAEEPAEEVELTARISRNAEGTYDAYQKQPEGTIKKITSAELDAMRPAKLSTVVDEAGTVSDTGLEEAASEEPTEDIMPSVDEIAEIVEPEAEPVAEEEEAPRKVLFL